MAKPHAGLEVSVSAVRDGITRVDEILARRKRQRQAQVALIAVVLLATTVGNMVMLVGLTGLGVEKLPFSFFDRYEKLILGLVLAGVGTYMLAAHTHSDQL